MIYPNHYNIEIENTPGVCMAGKDTLAIAECAAKVPAKNAIDIGTGTGFIAIYLAKKGVVTVATDVDDAAIATARTNIARNGVNVSCSKSDLFEHISGTYELIIFNTPLVAINSTYSGLVRIVLRRFPKISSYLGNLAFTRVRSKRKQLLKRFEEGLLNHSNERTHVVVLLHRSEVSYFEQYAPSVCTTHGYFDIIVFKPSNHITP